MKLINQNDVLNVLHNQLGHRVNPGGTDDDLKRYVQEAFNYAWRYHKWSFSLKTDTIDVDGLCPTDMDYEGYREFDGLTEVDLADTVSSSSSTSIALSFDTGTGRYKINPVQAATITYQYEPPTLGSGATIATGAAPFPSALIIAEGALIFAKKGENPTRADVQQEWDIFENELKKLAGRSSNALRRRPTHYLDAAGSYVGNVGS